MRVANKQIIRLKELFKNYSPYKDESKSVSVNENKQNFNIQSHNDCKNHHNLYKICQIELNDAIKNEI